MRGLILNESVSEMLNYMQSRVLSIRQCLTIVAAGILRWDHMKVYSYGVHGYVYAMDKWSAQYVHAIDPDSMLQSWVAQALDLTLNA